MALSKGTKSKDWSDMEIKILIQEWRAKDILDMMKNKSKKTYEKLTERVRASGVNRTKDQVTRKVQNLTSQYKDVSINYLLKRSLLFISL